MVPDREPRSYRRILIAAGVTSLAVCAGLFVGLNPEEPNISGEAGYQEEYPGYYPGGRNCYPSQIARLPRRERLEQSERCEEAREQHRLTTNDLIQQRRAANAAEAAAVMTYQQTRIAVWGLITGALTLVAAVLAATYAGVAATAAHKSNQLAAENAFTDHRPWLRVRIGPIEDYKFLRAGKEAEHDAFTFVLPIKIENIGRTPAIDAEILTDTPALTGVMPVMQAAIKMEKLPGEFASFGAILPGDEQAFFERVHIELPTPLGELGPTFSACLVIIIQYRAEGLPLGAHLITTQAFHFMADDSTRADGRTRHIPIAEFMMKKATITVQPWRSSVI